MPRAAADRAFPARHPAAADADRRPVGPRHRALRAGAAVAALLGALLTAAPGARGHPHVFVDHAVTASVGLDGLEDLQFAWTFDEMFSSMIALTFDADKDKNLSAGEVKAIEQRHFGHLKDFGYFLHLRVNDKPVSVTAYRDFQARLVNGQVVYSFTVPLKVPEGTIELAVDDPTSYAAFALNQRAPIQVQGGKNYRVDCRVARDGGSLSEVVKCTFRRHGR
jgi:ABC-type uncharacterized transport system substrate-binding protein